MNVNAYIGCNFVRKFEYFLKFLILLISDPQAKIGLFKL